MLMLMPRKVDTCCLLLCSRKRCEYLNATSLNSDAERETPQVVAAHFRRCQYLFSTTHASALRQTTTTTTESGQVCARLMITTTSRRIRCSFAWPSTQYIYRAYILHVCSLAKAVLFSSSLRDGSGEIPMLPAEEMTCCVSELLFGGFKLQVSVGQGSKERERLQ